MQNKICQEWTGLYLPEVKHKPKGQEPSRKLSLSLSQAQARGQFLPTAQIEETPKSALQHVFLS